MFRIDRSVFRAISGVNQVPAVGSHVYYFPQGHMSQCISLPDFSSLQIIKSFALCQVINVDYLAEPKSDELFVRVTLDPNPAPVQTLQEPLQESPLQDSVSAFAKILTISDANNGGGFSIPRYCAENVFPPLNLELERPENIVRMTDMHGKEWAFKHIYRGTPRRHLLTTGWSKFVLDKRLCNGDAIVFVRRKENENDERLFVGIRRSTKMLEIKVENESRGEVIDGFLRNGKGKVSAESVVEAVRLMQEGRTFDVVFYPKSGATEFMIEKEVVEMSLRVGWSEGMRFKMDFVTDDALTRIMSHAGVITGVNMDRDNAWLNSLWKMLQVSWDDPTAVRNVTAVSPWEIELLTPFPPLRRIRLPGGSDLPLHDHGYFYFNQGMLTLGNLPLYLGFTPTIPAGMQGARQFFPSMNFPGFEPGYLIPFYVDVQMQQAIMQQINTEQDVHNTEQHVRTPESGVATPTSQDNSLERIAVLNNDNAHEVRKPIMLFGIDISGGKQPEDNNAEKEYKENECGAGSLGCTPSSNEEVVDAPEASDIPPNETNEC